MQRPLLVLASLLLSAAFNAGLQASPQVSPTRQITTFAPSDARIAYSGRWNFLNPDRPQCAWQGCSFLVSFRGTRLSADLDSGPSTEYFRIIIDGDQAQSTRIAVTSGAARYDLASGLPMGSHTVRVVKETYLGRNATLIGLEVAGPGLNQAPAPQRRKIEFYGDSNLAGHSLGHEQNHWSSAYIGVHFGLAGNMARMFDAEYHNISVSGARIAWLHDRFDRIDRYTANPQWDFGDFSADLVIVNLGANDVGSSVNQIKAAYNSFLDDLRAVHPSAHIMLANAWGWDFNEPANYIHEVIAARGDPNMSSSTFPWVFEQWHGCEYDQAGMAETLAQHVSSVMGWSYVPSDVMSGFGTGGDVANGGFESIAPFGGFGWRYKDEAGVSRVFDPAGAHGGEYYVRLTGSDAIHQPNPAGPGEQVTVTWWAKGFTAGDRLDVTIDFRNQEMYTNPLQTTTSTFVMTTGWQQFTMSASAPTSGPNPVYHTRLTIKVRPGSNVVVDDVAMTTL